jgi:tetratricopeptide (TPR) repeat protein
MAEYANAEQLFLQAMGLIEKLYGKDHPYYAKTANNLGFTYEKMSKNKDAEKYYILVLEIHHRIFGEASPNYIGSVDTLIKFYNKIGEHDKARELSTKKQESSKES